MSNKTEMIFVSSSTNDFRFVRGGTVHINTSQINHGKIKRSVAYWFFWTNRQRILKPKKNKAMAKYKILMVLPGVGNTEMEVDGEPVHFPGFEAFTFFSHKSHVEDFWGCWDDWRVTELSSGCSIGGGFTLEEAMAKAKEQLAMSTPEKLQIMIDKALKIKTL